MGMITSSLRPLWENTGAQARKTTGDIIRETQVRLDGKTVLITGTNTGIGKETARALLTVGARVVITCRDQQKCDLTKADLLNTLQGTVRDDLIQCVALDLSSLDSCRRAANLVLNTYKSIDILILNAGVMMESRKETQDGLEMQIGVNHFGHFLFGNMLIPLLKKAAKRHGQSRFIVVSSDGHRSGKLKLNDYNWTRRAKKFGNGMQAYFDSKQANTLYAAELARKLAGSGILVASLHPGAIDTELARNSKQVTNAMKYLGPVLKTLDQGAATTVYCALSPNVTHGKYYQNSEENKMEPSSLDLTLADLWWQESERVTGFSWNAIQTKKRKQRPNVM